MADHCPGVMEPLRADGGSVSWSANSKMGPSRMIVVLFFAIERVVYGLRDLLYFAQRDEQLQLWLIIVREVMEPLPANGGSVS
ncbi:hypothetical protein CEXT_316321 [Caerostris extrusa]|uniref:Uncharacterized protein n=1 Tax=Caerostris extrusa TaxID=172846 RepID=A0AAV4VN81_CAEEX|nr:hypothetical protein CEXT_316321 [Caerostris extrusa]